MALMRDWSLRRRVFFLGLAPALFMMVLLLGYFLQARLSDAERELSGSGQLMARQLAASADYAVISGNVDSLSGQIDALLQQPGVVRVRVFAADGGLLLEKQSRRFHPGFSMRRYTASIESVALAGEVEDWLAPLEGTAPRVLGRVEISFSNDMALAREREILFTGLILGGLALAATFMLANAVAMRVRRPLEAVVAMVERLEARDFSARVNVDTGGEIGKLGIHLNALAHALEEARTMQTRYTQDLVNARAMADRANRAKSEFLAMMSHELRTPLNGVSGMLQLLESTSLDGEQQEYVHHAAQAGTDLLRMVDDILDFSRLEQGKLHFEQRPFDPADVFAQLVSEFQGEADRRGLQLVLEEERLPVGRLLLGDPLRLRQIITRLLDNALKFTPAGRITLHVRYAERPGQQALLTCEVCDTGIGIAPERLAQVFEPFTQGESSSSRRYGGTGMGLSISRRLAELMHGNLRVDSEQGVGSCFVFEVLLPWQGDVSSPVTPGMLRAGIRILVVEDNPANQLVAEGMLRSLGCQVVVAADGQSALRCLEQDARSYSLVFMDCVLPDMTGFEVTRRWRGMEQGGRLPIIALTAHSRETVIAEAGTAGMDGVLTKPFRRQELEAALLAWVRQD